MDMISGTNRRAPNLTSVLPGPIEDDKLEKGVEEEEADFGCEETELLKHY